MVAGFATPREALHAAVGLDPGPALADVPATAALPAVRRSWRTALVEMGPAANGGGGRHRVLSS